MIRQTAVLVLATALFAGEAPAEIYKWVDDNGQVHYTDRPPGAGKSAGTQRLAPSAPSTKANAQPQAAMRDTPTREAMPSAAARTGLLLDLRSLLRRHQFGELNRRLEGYQSKAESEVAAEDALFRAYEAFAVRDMSYASSFDAWIAAAPSRYPPYLARAMFRYEYRRENYEQALLDLNRAIALNPENAEYHYWRSKVYSELKRYDQAVADVELSIQLEPNIERFEKHRKWLASKLTYEAHEQHRNQRPADALAQYDAALKLEPGNAVNYYRRARALTDLHRYDSALDDMQRAIDLDPDDINYYLLADWLLAQRKDWNGVIAYWDRFIARHPENGRAYIERGGAYYRKGDLRSAVSDAKKSADLGNPQGREAYEKFRHRIGN